MGSDQYKIDWSADITPALAMLGNSMRSAAYLDMEREAVRNRAARESAALKRQEEQDKYNRSVQAFTALPGLKRMAQRDIGAANTNPYGYKFDEETAPGPSLRDSGVNVMDAQGGQYGDHARAMLGQSLIPPSETNATLQAGEEGPEQDPGAEAARFAPPVEAPPAPEAPAQGFTAAEAMLGRPQAKRLFMTYGGQRSEVPGTSETSGFGEQYDAMYNALVDGGEDPHKARAFIAARAKQDMADTARDSRLVRTLDQRNTNREDTQQFTQGENEKYKETHAGRLELVDRAGRYKVAASAPALKADAANSRDMGVLRQQGNAIRATTQYAKLDAKDKTVRSLFLNISNGSVPLQHGDAQIQLARYFRGTTPTEGEMALLYHNLGGTKDKWNQFVARMQTGDLSPEQLRQLKVTARGVRKEHDEDKKRFVSTARHMLGPGSGFDNMPDQAQALFDGMASELGIEGLPPLYDTEGGVTLGSGKRPNPTPRKPSKGHLDSLESEVSGM